MKNKLTLLEICQDLLNKIDHGYIKVVNVPFDTKSSLIAAMRIVVKKTILGKKHNA